MWWTIFWSSMGFHCYFAVKFLLFVLQLFVINVLFIDMIISSYVMIISSYDMIWSCIIRYTCKNNWPVKCLKLSFIFNQSAVLVLQLHVQSSRDIVCHLLCHTLFHTRTVSYSYPLLLHTGEQWLFFWFRHSIWPWNWETLNN